VCHPCAIHLRLLARFAAARNNLNRRAAMTTASPASTRPRSYRLPSPPPSRIRDGHVARQRAANASCSLWLRILASNAGPAKTVVGSGKRPTQTTARRLRYGVARTDTSDFSAPRGSHHCGDVWIHRIGWCAEEQAARTRVLPSGLLLWIDGGRDPARKASRPERARNRRPVR
jgi:hypothetical protein